jgi:hypothetical protein
VSCIEIPFTSGDALSSSIKTNAISVIYIAPGNSNNISAITQASQSGKILTITGVPDYVEKGLSVGIGLKADDNKPEIIINLPISKAEGSDFDANLLKLARVIK